MTLFCFCCQDDHGSKCVTITSLKPGMVRTKSQSSVGTPKMRPKKLSHRQRAKTTAASSSDSEEETELTLEKGHGQFLVPDQKSQVMIVYHHDDYDHISETKELLTLYAFTCSALLTHTGMP